MPSSPRHAGMLDGRQRRSAGAAGIAGDYQVIRSRFYDAGGNRANADGSAELDADAGFRIAVLQIVNELRDVLDGIDVVVRRRADEADAGRGVANGGDVIVYFSSRQLAALAGFRALYDLDLQFVGVGQVIHGHAKATAGYLLDRRALGIAVVEGRETSRVFAAFAGIGFAANAIHGDGEAFVRFFGNRTEAHGAGGEAAHDFFFAFHFVESDFAASGFVELQQTAQRGTARTFFVGLFRKPPISFFVVAARRHLQIGDGFGIPHVRVAVATPVEVARVRQHRQRDHALRRKSQRVATLHFFRQNIEANALHAACRTRETALYHVVGQSDGLENLRAFVGLQRRYAHLRHHFQHALGDAFLVGVYDVGIVCDVLGIRQITVAKRVPQRLEGKVRIDGVGAETGQQTMMMHFAGFAGFHHQTHARAAGGSHQVMMHGAGRRQGADRYASGVHRAVGKYQQVDAVGDRLRGFGANAIQRAQQTIAAGVALESNVDRARTPTAVIDGFHRRQFVVGKDRLRHAQTVGMALGYIQ